MAVRGLYRRVARIDVRKLGPLGVLGVTGLLVDEPALFALFALFGLFGVDREVVIPGTE